MKTLLSLYGGAITLTEEAGVLTLSFSEAIGGGSAAGLVKGSGSIVFGGAQAIQLGEKMLNALLPAALQGAAVAIEAVANAAIAAIE